METRKEIRELHRMACPILCHYVLTSLFEMFDQAIIGQNSTRGLRPGWNCICCVIWGYRSIGNAVFCVSYSGCRKEGKTG